MKIPNGDRNKNREREMPPEMMETPPFPGIPTAVPTEPTTPAAVHTYLLLYQIPTTVGVMLYVLCTYVMKQCTGIRKEYLRGDDTDPSPKKKRLPVLLCKPQNGDTNNNSGGKCL